MPGFKLWYVFAACCAPLTLWAYTTTGPEYSRFLWIAHLHLIVAGIGVWRLLRESDHPFEGFHFFVFATLMIQVSILFILLGACWVLGFLPVFM